MVVKQIKSVKGMHDLLPEASKATRNLEALMIGIAEKYGYQEIRTPLVEHKTLFVRSAGISSDIVHKEMYSFTDQNGDELSLRPEGTAACIRAGIEHGLFYSRKQRLWYLGNMFRRERPQKGRYRQFNQFGIEAIGFSDKYIEVEIISLISEILHAANINYCLELNHLGSDMSRKSYISDLSKYLQAHYSQLDEDSQKRLKSNPLRILDSKCIATQNILSSAPMINEYLTTDELSEFEFITNTLTDLSINYSINPKLVRGLDYYTGTVFEWICDGLTICAGGRYDSLIKQLGGKQVPAVGIAIGVERLLAAANIDKKQKSAIAILCNSSNAYCKANEYANILRQKTDKMVYFEYNVNSLKPLLKLANQNNCLFAIIIGQLELDANKICLKNMMTGEQNLYASMDDVINLMETENV